MEVRMEGIAAIVLAGNKKIRRELRRKKRRGFYYRLRNPKLWLSSRERLENAITSSINRDDYIVGENKSLLYLHPDLIQQENINFLKRVLYFAGKTGDRVYRRNKEDLLHFLSEEGITPISLVVRALKGSNYIDSSRIVVVGPGNQIRRELGSRDIQDIIVVDQGNSLGENILKGAKELRNFGYDKDYTLMIGGDVPLVTSSSIDDLMACINDRGGEPDLFYGVGSRKEVGEFIKNNGIEHMGIVGPNHPKKGNLNKFGFPIIDDIPLFGKKDHQTHMMIGNVFLYRTRSINRKFIDRFYKLRKMAANPLTYPYLIWNFGSPLIRSLRWKMNVTDAEASFDQITGVQMKLFPVHPEVAMDMDSYSDLRRLSALHFHRTGGDRDLERDFKDYVKNKRKRARIMKKGKKGRKDRK